MAGEESADGGGEETVELPRYSKRRQKRGSAASETELNLADTFFSEQKRAFALILSHGPILSFSLSLFSLSHRRLIRRRDRAAQTLTQSSVSS